MSSGLPNLLVWCTQMCVKTFQIRKSISSDLRGAIALVVLAPNPRVLGLLVLIWWFVCLHLISTINLWFSSCWCRVYVLQLLVIFVAFHLMSLCVKLIRVLSLCVVNALLFYFGSSVSSVHLTSSVVLSLNVFTCLLSPSCRGQHAPSP